MKTRIFSLALAALAATSLVAVGHAQTQVATPSSPAPTAPGRIVYTPRLPTPTELTSVAAAQGLTVERIDQTAEQITATYKSSSGSQSIVAYQLLPNGASVSSPAPVQTGTTVVTEVAAPVQTRTVIVERDPFVYYNDPFYSPWGYGYYSPVRVNVGLGFGYGYRGYHGYRGGYGHRWHR